MDETEIYCENCKIFKPLEMFKNILQNPSKVSDTEIYLLNERRKKEKSLILDQDSE
jgi:hypothetical protein